MPSVFIYVLRPLFLKKEKKSTGCSRQQYRCRSAVGGDLSKLTMFLPKFRTCVRVDWETQMSLEAEVILQTVTLKYFCRRSQKSTVLVSRSSDDVRFEYSEYIL